MNSHMFINLTSAFQTSVSGCFGNYCVSGVTQEWLPTFWEYFTIKDLAHSVWMALPLTSSFYKPHLSSETDLGITISWKCSPAWQPSNTRQSKDPFQILQSPLRSHGLPSFTDTFEKSKSGLMTEHSLHTKEKLHNQPPVRAQESITGWKLGWRISIKCQTLLGKPWT